MVVSLSANQCEDLREIVFQGAREAIGQTDLVLHQAPAEFHALVQRAHRGALRTQLLEFIAVFDEQFELEFRIRGVILRPTWREGFAVFGHCQRVDGEQHQKVMGAGRIRGALWSTPGTPQSADRRSGGGACQPRH